MNVYNEMLDATNDTPTINTEYNMHIKCSIKGYLYLPLFFTS